MASADSEDYEHWPDDFVQRAAPAPSYDSHNGHHEHVYRASSKPKTPSPKPEQRIVYVQAQPERQPQAVTYPSSQHIHAYPVQYASTPDSAPIPIRDVTGGGISYTYHSAHRETYPGRGNNVWLGRTKDQVNEDNFAIAAEQSVYDSRRVVPAGMDDDQLVWVIELEGAPTLR